MPTLYLDTPGTQLQRRGHQLVAVHGGETLASVPINLLELVVAQATCQISSGSLTACLTHGIPIAYLSQHGHFLGRLEPSTSSVAALQRSQLHFAESPELCLRMARTLAAAKLRNCHATMRQWADGSGSGETLAQYAERAEEARDLEVVRGHEGAGAAAYFRAMGRALGPEWGFHQRLAHPAIGPVNAMLGFGYTLLFNLTLGAVRAAGLNPYLGCFHADREGHATLASDLMEEWRPVLVDRLVMGRLSHESPGEFEDTEQGTRMSAALRQRFLRAWEDELARHVTLPASGHAMPYPVAIAQQALDFARHVREPDVPYLPVVLH